MVRRDMGHCIVIVIVAVVVCSLCCGINIGITILISSRHLAVNFHLCFVCCCEIFKIQAGGKFLVNLVCDTSCGVMRVRETGVFVSSQSRLDNGLD